MIHYVIRTYTVASFPYIDKLIPLLNQFSNDPSVEQRQISICVYDDIIEFCGEMGMKYSGEFSHVIHKALSDKSPELRQAASYGVGISAQISTMYSPFYTSKSIFYYLILACLPELFRICNESDSKDAENIYSTENAISAIGKICKFGVVSHEIIHAWSRLLPIQEDYEECEFVYTYFIELVEMFAFITIY